MPQHPLVLADAARAEQFHLLGRTRRLFHSVETWQDASGIAWAGSRVGDHWIAFTWLGGGWVFQPDLPTAWASSLAKRRRGMRDAEQTEHQSQVVRLVRELRPGPQVERVAWAVHAAVMTSRCSVVRLPDVRLGEALWGRAREHWPRNWRRDLLAGLATLTWLHVADATGESPPTLGDSTALLRQVRDLRGDAEQDPCAPDCPEWGGRPHHHIHANVGGGFLGILEQFARTGEEPGVREYDFCLGSRRSKASTLRKVGKSGRLVQVFLPAMLGDPDACSRFSGRQHRLLQALVRELTRGPREKPGEPAKPDIIDSSKSPDITGRALVDCPYLTRQVEYVGFNGNGKRKGLGYLLTTEGGWLAKAGYAPDELPAFLDDLAALAGPLGLTVVGLHRRTGAWLRLDRMRALAPAGLGRREVEQLHVRVYTAADFLGRWCRFFGWPDPERSMPAARPEESLVALLASVRERRIPNRELAVALGRDPSFVSKLLRGKKPWPEGLLGQARAWVDAQPRPPEILQAPGNSPPPAAARPGAAGGGGTRSTLEVALEYLRRGWSVIPMRPGEKRPWIKWARFQSERPTVDQLRQWLSGFPDAGLAVALGPASGLFAIDVDGPEAHAALVERLGEEPLAPKVISGSGKPCRYHLYFQAPDVETKAKATPWHAKLEFRGRGGLVVLPPSLHPSGRRYSWAPGQSPDDLPPPQLPAQVAAALLPTARPTPPAPAPVGGDVEASPSTAEFLAGVWAEGPRWNERLFRAACDLRARDVPLEEAEPLLLAGARPRDFAEEGNARRTIASAYAREREAGRR